MIQPGDLIQLDVHLTPEQAAQLRPVVYECLKIVLEKESDLYHVTLLPGITSMPTIEEQRNLFTLASVFMPQSLPGIWHAIRLIDDELLVTLDTAFMNSAGVTGAMIRSYFIDILGLEISDDNDDTFRLNENPVPLAIEDASQEHKPLTREDLQPIFDDMPPIPAATEEHRQKLNTFFINLISELFIGEKCHPSAIQSMREEILTLLEQSIMPAETPIGNILSDALAAKMMQQALDRKHAAGIGKGVETTVNVLREILRAFKKIKMPEMTCFFRNRYLGLEEAHKLRRTFPEVLLSKLITDNGFEKLSEDGTAFIIPDIPDWADNYAALEGFVIPEVKDKIVITLDVQKLYNNGLTVQDVLDVMKRDLDSQFKNLLRFVVSPRIITDSQVVREGKTYRTQWLICKIAIIPDPDVAYTLITSGTNKKLIERFKTFIIDSSQKRVKQFTLEVLMTTVILPRLRSMRISGIPNITGATVKSRVITVYSLGETLISSDDNGDQYKLKLDRQKMLKDSMLEKDIAHILQKMKFEVESIDRHECIINDPNKTVSKWNNEQLSKFVGGARGIKGEVTQDDIDIYFGNLDPNEAKAAKSRVTVKGPYDYIHKLYMRDVDLDNAAKQEAAREELRIMQEYVHQRDLGQLPAGEPPLRWTRFAPTASFTELMKINRVNYLQLDGSNVTGVIARHEIDTNTIYSSDVHQMLAVFGIAVARQVTMLRFSGVMGDETNYIDPSFILTITELMSNRGKIYGIDYTGLKQQQTNSMALATSERPTKVLTDAASISAMQPLSAVSEQIMAGQRIKTGSPNVDIVSDDQLIAKMAAEGLQLSLEDIDASLDALNKIYAGPQPGLITRPVKTAAPTKVPVIFDDPSSAPPEFPASSSSTYSIKLADIGNSIQKGLTTNVVITKGPRPKKPAAAPEPPSSIYPAKPTDPGLVKNVVVTKLAKKPEAVVAPVVNNELPVIVPGSLPKPAALAKLLKKT